MGVRRRDNVELSVVLRAASRLIKQGWCRRSLARNHKGELCHPSDKNATQFCLIGAVEAAAHRRGHAHPLWFSATTNELWDKLGFLDGPGIWNDCAERTQEEVEQQLLILAEMKEGK